MSVKSFFKTLESDVASMWHKLPSASVVAASAVNALVPVVEQLDTIILPELAPELNPILDKVKVGISAIKSTIGGAGSTANVKSIAASVQTNLTALVSAAQVKDPATAEKIKEVTDIIAAEIQQFA